MSEEINKSKREEIIWASKIPRDLGEITEIITETTGMKDEELLTNSYIKNVIAIAIATDMEKINKENMEYWKKNRKLKEALKVFRKSDEEKTIKHEEIMELKDAVILEKTEKIEELKKLVVHLISKIEDGEKYQEEIASLKEDKDLVNQKISERINEIESKEIEVDDLTSLIIFYLN